MPQRLDPSVDSAPPGQAPTIAAQHRSFIELSHVLSAGEPGLLSSALPLIAGGAGLRSAALFSVVAGEIAFLTSDAVPMTLRAYLEEPSFIGAPDFLAHRAFRARRTTQGARIFGEGTTALARAALDEAGWHTGVAVPILCGGTAAGVILSGARSPSAFPATIPFLEAAAGLLGAALRGSIRRPRAQPVCSIAAGPVAPVVESLAALGRDVADQHALLRELCFRPGAPPETDRLLGHTRSLDRAFRRLCEVALHPRPAEPRGRRRPTSMATVAGAAVQSARPSLAAAGAQLEVRCAPSCDFEGDPDLMAVAVRHLVVNAAEAFASAAETDNAPSSRRCVRISVSSDASSAALHLEDSGPGIPHDLRPRVFEPSISTKGPGRGIGLAVARSIVEAHGGWMELGASDLGGVRASIFVPVRARSHRELSKAATVPQMPAASPRTDVRDL
ncbi:MAG: HAMP domain-containing sensor histidine kinase [Polyangiaceae bacterium]